MKHIVFFIYFILTVNVFAQDDNEILSRANSGDLSLEECFSFVKSNNLFQAIPSLEKQKKHYEIKDNFDAEAYYYIIMALYLYNIQEGNIVESRNLIDEAMAIYENMEDNPNNTYIRSLLCCRGNLESTILNYDEALKFFLLANNYFEEANDYGDQYMILLNNIGVAYLMKEDLLSAKLYFDEAKDLFEKFNGSFFDIKEDILYEFVAYYATMLLKIGHKKEAESYFKMILEKCENSPIAFEAYQSSITNLSQLYQEQGRWQESISLLKRSRNYNSMVKFNTSRDLAISYLYAGREREAIDEQKNMNAYSYENLEEIFTHYTGIERERYWDISSTILTNVNNCIANKTKNKEAITLAYNNTLFCKSMTIKAMRLLDDYIAKSSDMTLKYKHKQYKDLMTELEFKNRDAFTRDSLRHEIILLEREILNSAGQLGKWLRNDTKTWNDVRQSLKEDEIAIEYSYFPTLHSRVYTQFSYCAFVLRKDFESPIFIPLEDINLVNSLFYYNDSDEFSINELYTTSKQDSLYNKIWKDITPYLRNISTIYYSTNGPLSNINFDIIRDEEGKMLREKYKMVRVSSTANIINLNVNSIFKTSRLYGNIKYDESTEEMVKESSSYINYSGSDISSELALRSENERGRWGAIPSTRKEIENVEKILSAKGISVKMFQDKSANEESFKSMTGNSPDIIHLATHGFVIDTQKRAEGNKFFASTNVFSPKNSYMMWAGIMLAGGNNTWQGNFNLQNVEDGVLTADEISRLDLSNTKLVVLSACETARGKIDSIEGVYGLQRAFKMAGVKTIVMSLWKVQDDATSMLMTQFYTHLSNGIEKHQALWNAMMDVRKEYKDPYYWAGFIMLD